MLLREERSQMAWNLEVKPRVKICIPHWGNVSLEWARQMFGPLQFVQHPAFDKDILLMRGILNLDTERNELVKMAQGDPSMTHILFVDTDVITEMDVNQAIAQMLAYNVPIVSGLYRAKQKTGFNYATWMKAPEGIKGYVPITQWSSGANWLSVSVVGAGLLLVKKEVFQKVTYPWFKWDQIGPSEDFYFCEKAKKAGYEINVATDIKCSHEGKVKIRCDGTVTLGDI